MNLLISLQSTLIRLLDTSQAFRHRIDYSMTNENLAKPQTIDNPTRFAVFVGSLFADFKFGWCRVLDPRAESLYLQRWSLARFHNSSYGGLR